MKRSSIDIAVFDPIQHSLANPAVATNWQFTVPARYRYQFVAGTFTIVTDANVANRTVRILFESGGTTFTATSITQNIPASVSRGLNFMIGYPASINDASGEGIYAPLPSQLFLRSGDRITSSVRAMQAGDSLQGITLRFHRWAEF